MTAGRQSTGNATRGQAMTDDLHSTDHFGLIQREHRALREALGAAQDAMRDGPRNPAAARSTLERLHQCIRILFAHEEENGYMHDVVQRAPRYAERVNRLLEEHGQILSNIESLRDRLSGTGETFAAWHDVQSQFADFAARLSEHEARENSILQKAYTSDIGTKD